MLQPHEAEFVKHLLSREQPADNKQNAEPQVFTDAQGNQYHLTPVNMSPQPQSNQPGNPFVPGGQFNPQPQSNAAPQANAAVALTREHIAQMSVQQINDNWEHIKPVVEALHKQAVVDSTL